ncbi:MAG: hypothetical protein JXR73_16030, partial [Candidatus Omnitrophica bacterium]|nr:hypothetical protein [Candidatus Omnitrophota bacterium]
MSPRWRQWLMVFGFFVVGALAYRPAFNAFFLADDFFFLSYVREQGLKAAWTCFPRDFLRPMVMGSFWWDSTLWGLNGWGFHLTNVLFHTLNALLVASLAEFWLKQNGWDSLRAQWLAPLAGLIFLVHPSHTEAVSWISGRSDVLAVFWGLSSLLAYLRWRSSGRRLWLPGAWCLFGLALLSKESMITLPLIILLLERFSPNPPSSNIRRWTPAAGYIAVVLLYGAARWAVLGAIIGGYGESIHMRFDRPFWIRNLLFYTTRTVLPVGEWRIHESVLFYGKIILWMTASLGIVQLLFRRRAKDGDSIRRLFLPEWFWMLAGMYLFSLLPVINLGVHLGTSLGERFIYWPSVFAVLLIVCLCDVLLRRRQWGALGVLTAIILIYTATLYRANWIWQEAGQISRQLLVDIQEY